ncbi:MAG: outer membrane beta-barrel protein [Bacteroidota bacterium]
MLFFSPIFCRINGCEASAQFFRGIGITGGVTLAKEKWFFFMPDSSISTQKKKNVFGLNGSLRLEFIDNDYMRWVTEFQINQKGCKDKTDSITFKNRINYLCWNNFLKFQYEIFDGFPYILFGPRVEYLLTQNINSPAITNSFNKFNFSWSVGVGWEHIVYNYFKPIIEIHYNPDFNFIYAYETDMLKIYNCAWEIRIGLIYRPGRYKSCPAVLY